MATAPKLPELVEQIVEEKIIVEEKPESTLTLADAQPANRTRPRAFYTASQWHIVPGALDGYIEAINNTTGDKYDGTIADFNNMLKGN
jgi:hypothetical protein